MNVEELNEFDALDVEVGDSVYLVCKYNGDVIKATIDHYSDSGKKVAFASYDRRHRYKLLLDDGEVDAINARQYDRKRVKGLYRVWEKQRVNMAKECLESRNNKKISKAVK